MQSNCSQGRHFERNVKLPRNRRLGLVARQDSSPELVIARHIKYFKKKKKIQHQEYKVQPVLMFMWAKNSTNFCQLLRFLGFSYYPTGKTRFVMSSRTAGYIAHSCDEWYLSMNRFNICITCWRFGLGSKSFSTNAILLLEMSYSNGMVIDCGSCGTCRPILVSWSWNS